MSRIARLERPRVDEVLVLDPSNPSRLEYFPLGKATADSRARQVAGHSDEEVKEIQAAMQVKSAVWFAVSHWAKETGNLLPWQRSLAFSLGKIAARQVEPSPKQAKRGLEILEEAESLGFRA